MPNIVKNTTLPSLLDLLVPHSCRGCGHIGNILCDRCKNNIILENSSVEFKIPKSFPPIFIVGQRIGLLNNLIQDLKYHSTRAIAKTLAIILHQTLPYFESPVTIVPLPTISKHIHSRGLDHTVLISKHLAKIRHYKVKKILVRDQNTVQVGADRQTRIKQAAKAYSINSTIKIDPDTTYILFDDVWTTGASMKAAVKKLRQAGAKKIIVAILAVSDINQ